MAKAEELRVTLPTELARAVNEAVESGEYATVSDVIREAVRDWQDKRALRQLWDEGIASGSAGELDVNELLREARKRGAANS